MPLCLSVNSADARDVALRQAVDSLREGKIVMYPTDTLYGLAVDPGDAAAVNQLRVLKGERGEKLFPLIAASLDQVADVAEWTTLGLCLAERFWPGPLTLVLPVKGEMRRNARRQKLERDPSTIAIRIPNALVARELARLAGHPITATSANRSGAAPAETIEQALGTFGEAIAVMLDAGPVQGPPSTIVEATGEQPRLVREGVLPWGSILAAC